MTFAERRMISEALKKVAELEKRVESLEASQPKRRKVKEPASAV
jgi:BMFP domain-containing protein YqiC